jgi:hypothetical protein
MTTQTKAERRWVRGVTLAAVLLAAGSAQGQIGKDKKPKPPANTPAKQPSPDAKPEPIADKVLLRTKPRDWTVNIEIDVRAMVQKIAVDGGVVEQQETFKFTSAAVVFPVLRQTAAHRIYSDAEGNDMLVGELFFNERRIDTSPTFQEGYPCGTRLARWEMRNVEGNRAQLKLALSLTSWETTLDEALAATIPWPKGPWPAVANSTFQPQLYVEHEGPEVKALVKKWTDGQDPRSIPPMALAKWLTAKVIEHVQISGNGLLSNQDGTLMGFELAGSESIAKSGRGSAHDVTCFMTAVLRCAGLPARTVIGIDLYDSKGGSVNLGRGRGSSELRSWVEFCLIDPANNKEIWVPIDPARLRKVSNRAPAQDRTWKYFGTHDEMAYLVPLAFQFHPPTTVASMAPLMWGWLTAPQSQLATQSIRFSAFRMGKSDNSKRDYNEERR